MGLLDHDFLKGGPGSGNHGHAGRPGERGGSAPTGTENEDLDRRILRHVDKIEKLGISLSFGEAIYANRKLFLEVTEKVSRDLERVKDAGYDLPERLHISPAGFDNNATAAQFSASTKDKSMNRLEVNPISDYFISKSDAHKAVVDGWWAQDNAVIHETGHFLHWKENPKLFFKLIKSGSFSNIPGSKRILTPDETLALRARIRVDVSGYAATIPVEFVAEVFAGRARGKIYPSYVNKLYDAFGGPKVKTKPIMKRKLAADPTEGEYVAFPGIVTKDKYDEAEQMFKMFEFARKLAKLFPEDANPEVKDTNHI